MHKKMYKPIITMVLVTILLVASLSAAAGIKIFPIKNRIIEDTGTVKHLKTEGGFFEIIGDKGTYFAGRLWKEYYPINLPTEFKKDGLRVEFTATVAYKGLFNIQMRGLPIKILSIKQIQEKPKVTLILSMNKTFSKDEPIPVTTTIINTGNATVTISEMAVYGNTLSFDIKTPSSEKLFYFGPMITGWPGTVTLKPGMKTSVTTNIADGNWARNPAEYKKGGYRFYEHPGMYSIQAFYHTNYPPDIHWDDRWQGSLVSSVHRFKISSNVNLEFDIHIDDTFKLGEPIEVATAITNNGFYTVNVSEMGLSIRSLDFNIETPDGEILHYIGPYIRTLPRAIPVPSNETYSEKIGDIRGLFGVINSSQPYKFVPGDYTIQGRYTSGKAWNPVWEGELISRIHRFTVINQPMGRIHGMVYEIIPCTAESPSPADCAYMKPIQGAEVTAFLIPIPEEDVSQLNPNASSYTTYTDQEGKYELKLPPGAYEVQVTKIGYQEEHRIVMVSSDENKKIDFVLKKNENHSSILHGRVTEALILLESSEDVAPEGPPIPGAKVVAHPILPTLSTSTPSPKYVTYTDKEGMYRLNVLPGCYLIEVSKNGYESRSKETSIEADEIKKVDFQLPRIWVAAEIYGTVTEEPIPIPVGSRLGNNGESAVAGAPIPLARVAAYPQYPIPIELNDSKPKVYPVPPYYETYTNKNGDYELRVPPGCYIIEVTKKGYQRETKRICVAYGESKRLDFQLRRSYPSARIYGRVTEAAEPMPPYILPSSAQPIPIIKPKPIANATVTARLKYAPIKAPNFHISSVAPPFCYKTHTDRYGRYELRVKYPGYYIVEVTKKGYQKATKGVFVQREEEKRLDFQLHRLYSLLIISVYTYVSDPPVIPMPLAGVEITAVSTSSNLSYKGVTDESGRCRLIVKPGRYIVEVYKPGYVPCRKTTTVQVMWGEVASVRIGMKPMKPKILHIKESDNGKTLYVDKDWLMNLTLETNPSTGYQWEITKLNHSTLQLIDHFCWGYPHRDPPILGAPCNETWILKPISYGETTIELKYWRTWDPEDPFIKTFRVNIIIGENVL